MAFTRNSQATNNISALPNKPLITATALKQKFDQGDVDEKSYNNDVLLVELESTTPGSSGAENIGSATVSGLAGNTVWAQISALYTAIQNVIIGTLPDNSVTNDKIATASKIGLLADLTTSVKTNIVAAINSISVALNDGSVTWPKLAPDMQNRELTQDKAITELLMLADIDSKVFSPNLGKFYTNFSSTMDYSLGTVDATKQTYTGTLSAGATSVVLPSATGFSAGQEVSIQDGTNYEEVIVSSVVSTTVNFKTALVNSYTNPIVYRSNNNGQNFGGAGGQGGLDAEAKVLFHADAIKDNSLVPKTVTNNGVTIDTTNKKFGTGSFAFNGSNQYLTVPNGSDFTFGSGNLTVDGWIRRTRTGNEYVWAYTNSGGAGHWLGFNASDFPTFLLLDSAGSISYTATSNVAITDTNWHHYAGVRNGATVTLYVDGVAKGTSAIGTASTYDSVALVFALGRAGGFSGLYFAGNVDEFMVSKGIARWTSDFTPPGNPYDTGSMVTKNVIRMNIVPYEDVKYISAWLTKTDLTGFTADGKVSIVDASADENYVDLTETTTDLGSTQEVMMIGNSATADSKVTLKLELNRASTSDSVSFTKLIGGVSA